MIFEVAFFRRIYEASLTFISLKIRNVSKKQNQTKKHLYF